MLKNIIKTLKINHYIKNIVIFIPIIYSYSIYNTQLLLKSIIAFFAFCVISSAVYIFNDLTDIKQDRQHSTKKKRPLASGKISKKQAIILMILLIIVGLSLLAQINLPCLLMAVLYFILNVLYSIALKNIVIVDTLCIASGFILRVLCAYYAILIKPNLPVIIFVFFTSLFFTFIKRRLELQNSQENHRNSIKNFNLKTINNFILISSVLSILSYSVCILKSSIVTVTNNNYLFISIVPFALIILKFSFIKKEKTEYDPIKYIEKDIIAKLLIIFYFAIIIIVLFLI